MNEWDIIKILAMEEHKQLEIKISTLKKELTNKNLKQEEYQKKKEELENLIALCIAIDKH